jgi:hypothetical protein
MNRISRFATTVLVSGGLGLAGLGLGAGIANAGGAYQWCPGDDMGGLWRFQYPCKRKAKLGLERLPQLPLRQLRAGQCLTHYLGGR